jgi:hypothetical protein
MPLDPPDYETPEGQVRLLIADVSTDETKRLLGDGEITGYLAMNDANVKRAAADALDAIASSEALVSKVIRTQDLQTDGAKVADALRKHADRLRAQADTADDADDDGFFDIVDTIQPRCRPELTERPIVWGL